MGVGPKRNGYPIPTLHPLRAEQVPSVLCLDATPERDAAPGVARVLTCAFTVASPETGAPAPRCGAPPLEGEGIESLATQYDYPASCLSFLNVLSSDDFRKALRDAAGARIQPDAGHTVPCCRHVRLAGELRRGVTHAVHSRRAVDRWGLERPTRVAARAGGSRFRQE